jgi:two-component system, chemotaxis family, chemotaxis protein CheY
VRAKEPGVGKGNGSMPKASAVSVLIVDDQQSMRGIAKYILTQLGFKDIIEAKSGRDALGKLEKSNVDLIISDWNMDDIDGLTLLKVIRKHPRTQTMPFIMATGRSDKEQVKEAISFGVNNYIIKPFDAMTMKKRIEAVIGALT